MFHRFQVGAMNATIVSDGPLVLPAAPRIFRGPDAAAINSALEAAGLDTNHVRVEQNCLLLETAGRKILFDNGLAACRTYAHPGFELES